MPAATQTGEPNWRVPKLPYIYLRAKVIGVSRGRIAEPWSLLIGRGDNPAPPTFITPLEQRRQVISAASVLWHARDPIQRP